MKARLCIFAPIPDPSSWVLAVEAAAPAGHIRLCSLNISRHEPATKIPGTALVPVKDISTPLSDVERLVRAYAQCDAAGRDELLKVAECLAGSA